MAARGTSERAGRNAKRRDSDVPTWVAVLWSLPLLLFAALHLRGYLLAEAARERGEPAVDETGVGDPFPQPAPYESDTDAVLITQQMVMQTRAAAWVGRRPGGEEYDMAVAIAPVLLAPVRLVWWAWTGRTWRPLALLASLLLVCASPLAWFSGVGGSTEVYQRGVAFAWDAGLIAAAQAPLLLVIGAWPWWRRRSLIAGVLAAVVLVLWLVYVLPARR